MTSLLEALRLKSGVTLKNRLCLAPLTNGQSHDDGRLSDDEYRWLLRRGEGGFGLVETCAVFTAMSGKTFDGQLGLCSDAHEAALKPLAEALRETGALAVVQLQHGGARAPSRLTFEQPVAPSAFHEDTKDFEAPRELSGGEIEAIAEGFVDSAVRAERAGFGGVELHAAHGYLLCQFLSTTQNTRSDGWGGDLAGRARLLRDIAREIRARVAPTFVIGVRLSPEDRGHARGLDVDDVVQVGQWLGADGVDYVHISLWDAAKNTTKHPEHHPAALFRAALPRDVALIAAGGVWGGGDAQRLQDHGADIVCVGRAAIVDPDWIAHVIVEHKDPVRPPRTAAELAAVDVGPAFVKYLGRFPGFVA